MNPIVLTAVVLAVAGFAAWNAPKILAWAKGVRSRVPSPGPLEQAARERVQKNTFDAALQRARALHGLMYDLEDVGAKAAASKLKSAIATVIEEDLLRED